MPNAEDWPTAAPPPPGSTASPALPLPPSAVAGRADDLGGDAGAGGAEAEQVIGGGDEAGDEHQRAVGNAAPERRARTARQSLVRATCSL